MQIADFGSTKTLIDTSELAFTEIGTSGWTAPEVFGAQPEETGALLSLIGLATLAYSLFGRWRTGYGVKADVWSFGVLLWELIVNNPAANRFVGVPTVKYCRELATGARLDIPVDGDAEYTALTRDCWAWAPAARPSSAKCVETLQCIIDRLRKEAAGASAAAVKKQANCE